MSVKDHSLLGGRRRLLKQMLAFAAAGVTPAGPSTRALTSLPGLEPAVIPIIDTHQHLWDLTKFRLPWLAGAPSLNRSFMMSDYLKATEGLNVIKSIYMEVDVEPSQQLDEFQHVVEICKRGGSPMVAAVVSGRPATDAFPAYLAKIKASPYVKGMRQVLHRPDTPTDFYLSEPFKRGIRRLGEAGLSFDLCVRSTELAQAAKLVDACPDTSFILDHCGNASVRAQDLTQWKTDLARLAERRNAVCKVSGVVASAAPDPWTPDDLAPIVKHVLESFGPDRVVFGGDWPVCTLAATYRQWVEALKTIVHDRTDAENRKLFHDNALRVYRLS
jgi:predicted TIM-barrel fold metal-dependent hydrolase